jgi:hypothetical protein
MKWSTEKATERYAGQPWRTGCNFIPSTAINQLEMWQEDTFDPETIDRELGWAAGLGFNTVRTYLHDLVWEADKNGFRKRIDQFLDIAADHGIVPIVVFFDDCWCDDPKIGTQPDPVPGIHNSGWMRSPGSEALEDESKWPRLEDYVKDVLDIFSNDDRILLWDLYNEPGNSGYEDRSLPLLGKVFEWAREAAPSQPVTSGVYSPFENITRLQLESSDIVTFHNYNDAEDLKKQIDQLKEMGRPLICTEYMARTRNSLFGTCMPVFKEENVGCINWGFVAGKIQTEYPWGSEAGGPEPKIWFHDIFRKDGTPFDTDEVKLIKALTGK